jgi:hypothetical protein
MKGLAIVVASLLLSVSAASAGPKDKSKQSLINSSALAGTVNWNNGTVTGTVKSGKCKAKIQFKDVAGGLVGDTITCITSADVRATSLGAGAFGNSVVLQGVVEDNFKLKIGAKLSQIGCGTVSDAINFNSTVVCYEEDLSYDPATECGNAGMLWLPGDGSDGLLGLCQGLTANAGQRIPPPSSAVLCELGGFNPLDL